MALFEQLLVVSVPVPFGELSVCDVLLESGADSIVHPFVLWNSEAGSRKSIKEEGLLKQCEFPFSLIRIDGRNQKRHQVNSKDKHRLSRKRLPNDCSLSFLSSFFCQMEV